MRAYNMRVGHIIEIYLFIKKKYYLRGLRSAKTSLNSMKIFNLPSLKGIFPKPLRITLWREVEPAPA